MIDECVIQLDQGQGIRRGKLPHQALRDRPRSWTNLENSPRLTVTGFLINVGRQRRGQPSAAGGDRAGGVKRPDELTKKKAMLRRHGWFRSDGRIPSQSLSRLPPSAHRRHPC
jgi:hypothetical protein